MKKKLMTLEQRRLLREAQQLLALSERQKARKKVPEASESGYSTNTTVRLTRQVMDFLTKRYDFRYNLLTEETEFRPILESVIFAFQMSVIQLGSFA